MHYHSVKTFVYTFKYVFKISFQKKLTRISSKAAKEERVARLKRIVDDDYMLNRTIHRDVVNYVKRMLPHMKYVESLLAQASSKV